MEYSGSDLLETFHNLGINTGNVSKLTIDSWCDTDCEDTKKFLQWLCTSLGKDNVLTAHENEEYEQLLENTSLLQGKQYENAVEQLQIEYPGVLDYDKNFSEIECMKLELEMLREEESHLQQQLLVNGNLNKKLSQELKKVNEEEIMSTMKKKEAEKRCMECSLKLDESHEKLQSQIIRYAEHLNEFEHATRPTFISNVPSQSYRQYYLDIMSYLSAFLRREYDMFNRPDATIKLLNNTHQSLNVTTNQQEVLRRRISKSMQNCIMVQLKEEMLQAELDFLQNLDLNKVISSGFLNNRSSILLEANILSKEELLCCVCADLENVIQKISDGYVDTPQINIIENNIHFKQKKLEILTQLDNKVTEILAKHILLCLFIERERTDVQSTDKFFRDVHYYITHNLQNCQQRTESMIDIINEYKMYKDLPLEQKFKIIDILKALITDEDKCDANAMEVMRQFKNERDTLELQVFFTDYEENRRNLVNIEQEIEAMWKFLCGGPTKRIIAIPRPLSDCFNKINELYQIQENSLKSSSQLVGHSEKKLSDKWFQMKRQLWIWFLFTPEKVLRAIDQIELAVKQKRTEAK